MKYQRRFIKRKTFSGSMFKISCWLLLIFAVLLTYLFFTNHMFAVELKQIRQAKTNFFSIGIDVSGTIKQDVLEDVKDALIFRLKKLVSDSILSYSVYIFGVPGCGSHGIDNIISKASPQTPGSFEKNIGSRIRAISISNKRIDFGMPLTTPFYCFLENILPESRGGRVIIFSDLVNDDYGCERKYFFPEDAVAKFGKNRKGQIIFFYASPYVSGEYDVSKSKEKLINKQKMFIKKMKDMGKKGKVRVGFYKIPDDSGEKNFFFKTHLKNAMPETKFEIVWERVSNIVSSMVTGVRG